MKIWNGYGSEHSSDLVMVGQFKTEENATKAHNIINGFSEGLPGVVDFDRNRTRYTDEMRALMEQFDFYNLCPSEFDQFLDEKHMDLKGGKILIRTDESEISAFFKIMIRFGAKVEIFSAHEYPDEKYD